jgi:accessory gene regulator protein AgrB
MQPVKTYTYLDRKEKALGLEIIDFLLLAVVYALTFLLSMNLVLNLAVMSAVYLLLRLYKRGKPAGYTAHLVRFLMTPKFYTLPGREK